MVRSSCLTVYCKVKFGSFAMPWKSLKPYLAVVAAGSCYLAVVAAGSCYQAVVAAGSCYLAVVAAGSCYLAVVAAGAVIWQL